MSFNGTKTTSFFSGDEIKNIAQSLELKETDVEDQFYQCVDYLQLIFRIAEILEVPNFSAIECLQRLLFKSKFNNDIKSKLTDNIKLKEPVNFRTFSNLDRNSFSEIIISIRLLTDDPIRARRIEHAILDSIFYDLNSKNNLLSLRLVNLFGGNIDILSDQQKAVSILEENSFSLASRDLVKIFSDIRATNALRAYREGSKYETNNGIEWDTSYDIRKIRNNVLPAGIHLVSTSPFPKMNPGYFTSDIEKETIAHYFKRVKAAEAKKGNCFEGTAKAFYNSFISQTMPDVENYLTERFAKDWSSLKHLIITGIGGNEMLAHLIQEYANLNNQKIKVHLLTFPTKWSEEIERNLSSFFNEKNGLNKDNLAVIAFSRSGKTYETLRTIEFIVELFGSINLIGVANGGGIIDLVEKYNGLAIGFPAGIAGRLSTFNTPVFSLPMQIIDKHAKVKITEKFFDAIDYFDKLLSVGEADNLAWELAKKIFIAAYINGMNLKIYQGSNSKATWACFRHMEQVIMEGIKHNISCIMPRSMPDAAHFNMEQTLKFGELFYHFWIIEKEPLKKANLTIPVKGLNANESLAVLMKSQFEKIKTKSPMDLIIVDDIYDISTQAFIYKLVENTIYFLARLLGDDPEGNPDVKDVRDLSSNAEKVALKQKKQKIFDILNFYNELEIK